jgi:hypothetical protein
LVLVLVWFWFWFGFGLFFYISLPTMGKCLYTWGVLTECRVHISRVTGPEERVGQAEPTATAHSFPLVIAYHDNLIGFRWDKGAHWDLNSIWDGWHSRCFVVVVEGSV